MNSMHVKGNLLLSLSCTLAIQVGLLGNGQQASCIIVEGIPGIGKSTFSWHLGVCWSQKQILHGYHLVVLLRLRDESVQQAKCVSDLFYHHDQTTQQSVVQWISSLGGDGVMMVLDGYDELSSHLQTSSIFADIIKGKVLPKLTVLVSSRPSANQNLHQLCHSQKCQYIEVIGFGKEEIEQYVDGALEHNKELRDQLKSYLEHHPHIHGLMYVPLNCAIVVQVFRAQMKNKRQLPETHTEVYQLLVKTVLKRHEQKAKRPKRTHTIPSKCSELPASGCVLIQGPYPLALQYTVSIVVHLMHLAAYMYLWCLVVIIVMARNWSATKSLCVYTCVYVLADPVVCNICHSSMQNLFLCTSTYSVQFLKYINSIHNLNQLC